MEIQTTTPRITTLRTQIKQRLDWMKNYHKACQAQIAQRTEAIPRIPASTIDLQAAIEKQFLVLQQQEWEQREREKAREILSGVKTLLLSDLSPAQKAALDSAMNLAEHAEGWRPLTGLERIELLSQGYDKSTRNIEAVLPDEWPPLQQTPPEPTPHEQDRWYVLDCPRDPLNPNEEPLEQFRRAGRAFARKYKMPADRVYVSRDDNLALTLCAERGELLALLHGQYPEHEGLTQGHMIAAGRQRF